MTAPHLLDLARALLRKNDAGSFTKPGPRQYPHQWNWDSALIALGLSHFDLPPRERQRSGSVATPGLAAKNS